MKDKVFIVCFIMFLSFILFLNCLLPDKEISVKERRRLETYPKVTVDKILDKSFMQDFDDYVLDQFAFRDFFRQLKANVSYKILNKLDNNRIYLHDDYVFKSEYPTNMKSIGNFIDIINNVSNYLTPNNKVYYSVIPDKNYYVDNNKFLNIDYHLLYKKIKSIKYDYIELRDILNLDDYYKTDTHWKQENLCKVVNRIGEHLNFHTDCKYNKITFNDFYGVYYGQSGLKLKPDNLTYLTNSYISNSQVYYLENNKINKVYIEEYFNNIDSYDIFLSGASAYIEITNNMSKSGKELIIFRDSFSSSLAPLLIEYYSKITLIDLRYMNSEAYLKKIKFNDQDVLFLYSTLLVNNSYTLKK